MPRQLDILALEPFYGGPRRAMLETVVRYSRHRWTLFKLPPRRMERRLTTAAAWFAELLTRHWEGRLDLLFTSEAMNLASLFRLVPHLGRHPSVVYFHDNQLPVLTDNYADGPLDLVNLNTAQSATETWFNSHYHKQTFLIRAAALVDRHPELSSRDPVAALSAKSRLMAPPVDLSLIHEMQVTEKIARDHRAVFVETRDANMPLLNAGLDVMRRRKVGLSLVTVGPVVELDPRVPRKTVSELDDLAQVRAMFGSAAILSVKAEASSDYQVVRALSAGCRPVLPDSGVYPEILPHELHKHSLYEVDADSLADCTELALTLSKPPAPPWHYDGFRHAFRHFDAIAACRAFDERIEQLVASHPVGD